MRTEHGFLQKNTERNIRKTGQYMRWVRRKNAYKDNILLIASAICVFHI